MSLVKELREGEEGTYVKGQIINKAKNSKRVMPRAT
jgi:hypothetical protein